MEAEYCPSLHNDDDMDITEIGCDVRQRKLEFLAHQKNRKFNHWQKENALFPWPQSPKPYTSKEKHEKGYKAFTPGTCKFVFYTPYYRENMKGGHTHNHVYNAAYTAVFGRHSLRRIPRESKTEWRMAFEHSYKQYPNLFSIGYTKKRRTHK